MDPDPFGLGDPHVFILWVINKLINCNDEISFIITRGKREREREREREGREKERKIEGEK